MVKQARLSEKIMFRTTADEHHRLIERAQREHRSLANLVYAIVRAALEQAETTPLITSEAKSNEAQS